MKENKICFRLFRILITERCGNKLKTLTLTIKGGGKILPLISIAPYPLHKQEIKQNDLTMNFSFEIIFYHFLLFKN